MGNFGEAHGRPPNRQAKLKHLDHCHRGSERPLIRGLGSSKSAPSVVKNASTQPDCMLFGHRPVRSKILRCAKRRPLSPIAVGPLIAMQPKPFPDNFDIEEVAAWALDLHDEDVETVTSWRGRLESDDFNPLEFGEEAAERRERPRHSRPQKRQMTITGNPQSRPIAQPTATMSQSLPPGAFSVDRSPAGRPLLRRSRITSGV